MSFPSTVSKPPVDVPPEEPSGVGVLPPVALAELSVTALSLAEPGSSAPTGRVEPSLESARLSGDSSSGAGSLDVGFEGSLIGRKDA